NIIDNAIIFIDEFDSNKEKIMDYIINNGLQGKVDTIRLFKSIYSALKTNNFPEDLTISFKTGKSSKFLKNSIKNIQKKAEELYKNYNLSFPHHTAPDAENHDKNFLFHGYQFHSILNGDNQYITTITDHKAKQNIIHFMQKEPEVEKYNIHSMLGELRKFIQCFQDMIKHLANHYRKVQNKQHQNDENELTQEETVRSILDLFQLSTEDINYLTTQIMTDKFNSELDKEDEEFEFDQSFYEKGFRYYCFENSTLHNMRTRIMMCSFRNSPEKFLLQVCKHAKVIGISATATIPTVIGNFDLEYIQSKLQERYYTLSDEEYERLAQDFYHSQTGYDSEIQIHTELIGATNYSVQTWLNIFQNFELAQTIYNLLENRCEKSIKHYCHQRYARIAMAFKQFLIHDDIQSMLCFLTKLPKNNNDSALNLKQLKEVLKFVAVSIHSDFDVEEFVLCLTSENYEIEKKAITARLAKNEKLFVISAYQTVGAGQNLQYKIPESLKNKLICSNFYLPRKDKDFDAIYLDKPTQLLVNINMKSNLKEEDFIKYLFQIEFLRENAELSIKQALEYIRMAFRYYMTGENSPKIGDIYLSKSIKMYVARIIIQAIGRICRTNQKRQHIYIFADDRISDCIDLSVTNKRILNYEFLALVNKIKDMQKTISIDEITELENKAKRVSNRASVQIDYMLNHEWTESMMKTWIELRQFVIKNPTISKKEILSNRYTNYYVELPKKNNVLYYTQSKDFHEVSVYFQQKSDTQILNSENTRLIRLMKWQTLFKYFISQGYATDFQPNDYILSPPLWNNIYKGALGEIVGSFWFQQVLGIHLEELTCPEEFELFDFKITEKKIYVDFKNWSEATTRLFKEEIEKIKKKAKQCKCECVIIANILTRKNYDIHKFTDDGIVYLIIPSLLNDTESEKISVNLEAVKKIKEVYQ
ncbi:MAG: hypothetical protein K2K06_11555, partial [Oscillospiraceae bacterium]|nr:hypothetical protein [Oscillospiraceae bacterium]